MFYLYRPIYYTYRNDLIHKCNNLILNQMINYQERNREERSLPNTGNVPRPTSPERGRERGEQPNPGRVERPVAPPSRK